MAAPVDDDWLDEIRLEHNQIRGLLSVLEGKLTGGGPRGSSWAKSIAESLEKLLELLEAHFAREEEALAPEQAQKVFPRLAVSIARLNAEHAGILEIFRAALRSCRTGSGAVDADAIVLQIATAIADIRRHERKETELFADVELGR